MNTIPIYIAYAEDHAVVRTGVKELIQSVDDRFKVFIEAENGKELLENIAKASHQPDVCLIDINMPEMNGYEAMLQIKNKYPYIRCLALTMADNDHAMLQMLANGAMGYVTKNSNIHELKKAVLEVYEGNFYFCKEVLKLFPKISRHNLQDHLKQLLSDREVEFLSLCCSDMSYAEIGQVMHLSDRTAENYAYKLGQKLNIHSRVGLALYAVYAGISKFRKKCTENP
jgi:DNA-binding NarL/FixJ family response regulator